MTSAFAALARPGQFVPYYGARLFIPRGHFDEAHMLGGGKPEPHVLETFARFVGEGDTVLDIGANIGTHSFALASLVGERGRVYAVEADIDNASAIRASVVESGLRNVHLLVVAAAAEPGLIRALATERTNSVFSARADGAEIKIACTLPLDAVIEEAVSFIKIDIEGAELLALQGLSRTIARSRPVVLSEFSPIYIINALGRDRSDEFFAVFAEAGYDCFYLDPFRALHPVPDYPALLAAQRGALERLSWNHIDVLFVPRERPLAERAAAG